MYTRRDLQIIETFKSTYNARYLRDFEGVKIDKINSLKSQLRREKKMVLVRLIDNLINYHINSTSPPYNIQNIEGPYYLKKMRLIQVSKEQELPIIKTAYIFGERHTKNEVDIDGSCLEPKIRFNEYLKLLSQKSPAFTDIYLENHFSKDEHNLYSNITIIKMTITNIFDQFKSGTVPVNLFSEFKKAKRELIGTIVKIPKTSLKPSSSFMIHKIKKDFINCISPRYNKLECEIIRVHSIDMRRLVTDRNRADIIPIDYTSVFYFLTELFGLIKDDSLFTNPLRKRTPTCFLIKFFNDQFKNGTDKLTEKLFNIMENNPEGLIEAFRTNKKIEKEHSLSYERDNIDIFFKQKIRLDSNKIISTGKILKKCLGDTLPTLDEFFSLRSAFVNIGSMVMDYYGLLRIFKDYPPRVSKPLDHPLRSTNIIIYAGANHSKTYSAFFESIGFKPYYDYENPKINFSEKGHCVDTKQPIVKGSKKRTIENVSGDIEEGKI